MGRVDGSFYGNTDDLIPSLQDMTTIEIIIVILLVFLIC